MNEFTCEKCNGTFKKSWSHRRAKKELVNSPWFLEGEDIGVLCDKCFKVFKIWFHSLTEEDHKRLREGK